MSEYSPDSVMNEAFGLLEAGQAALWLELYAAFPEETRTEFPDVVHQMLDREDAIPTATLVAPLYGEESDPSVREHFIQMLAFESCIESAQVLQLWKGLAPTRRERRAIRAALAQLGRRGIEIPSGEERAWESQISARMSSADGMGSYRIVIEFRIGRSSVFLAFAINVDAGLREAERMGADAAEFLMRFGEDYGLADAEVSPSMAALTVRQAVRCSRSLGRELPEGWSDASAWLDKIPSATILTNGSESAESEVQRPRVPSAAIEMKPQEPKAERVRLTTRQLALRREFETWFLPPVAELRRRADAYLTEMGGRRTGTYANRTGLLQIVSEYVIRPAYRERLVAMLRHQAELYLLRGDVPAMRAARRSIDEVELGQVGRGFLKVFAERSLECLSDELSRSDPLPPDERRPAWVEALRPLEPPRRRDVVRADFAVLLDHVLATELDLVPLVQRPTESQLIEVITNCADAVVERLELRARAARSSRTILTQQDARLLASEFTRLLRLRTALGRGDTAAIGRVLAERTRAFANQACGQYCTHACPAALDACGEALYDIEGHPARLSGDTFDPALALDAVGPRTKSALPGALLDELRRLERACRVVGLHTSDLAQSFARWERRFAISEGLQPWSELGREAAHDLCTALRAALERLPRLSPSSDPETRSAWEAFASVYPVLPVELVSRMIARSERSTDVLAVLLGAAEGFERRALPLAEVRPALERLWNATPRPELHGRTPNQVEDSGR